MKTSTYTLLEFEDVLLSTDWEVKNLYVNPDIPVKGLTSIAHAADYFIALSKLDQVTAKKLLAKYQPRKWKGWPIVVKAARRRLKGFEQAIKVGTFSDNPYDENYYEDYFFSHSEGGRDIFRHRETFVCIESPYSKAEVLKHVNRNLFRTH